MAYLDTAAVNTNYRAFDLTSDDSNTRYFHVRDITERQGDAVYIRSHVSGMVIFSASLTNFAQFDVSDGGIAYANEAALLTAILGNTAL